MRVDGQEVRRRLHRFTLSGDRLAAAVCQKVGLAPRELEALEHLEEDGPLTQRDLADRLGLSSGGMTLLVDRLEQVGLVARRPHPSDRRAVLLHLQSAAAADPSVAVPLERYHDALLAAARRLSPSEREAVAGFLAAAAAAGTEAAEAVRVAGDDPRRARRGSSASRPDE